MHDLRLVGVHEDGEHLLLGDAEGGRFLLAVDDALRAAVRRDRPHLGQLQIEIEGGLRPRDVQARIRAGATAEEVAALAGWPVEKVRRYEGPVLAERDHVSSLAREVHLRRRGGSVTLGGEVSRRLAARGVDMDQVRWDSWRVDGDPWTVVVTFSAGGRERSARWHLDLAGRSVTPGDDEARWLSEDHPDGEGPLAGARLSSVPIAAGGGPSHVYDVEVDGGIAGSAPGAPASSTGSLGGEALDLVGAMRARRQGARGRRGIAPRDTAGEHAPDSRRPTEPGVNGVHPAGRKRPRPTAAAQPEPLDLDPSLMDDPPAAHPPAQHPPLADGDESARSGSPSTVTPLRTSPVSPLGVPLVPAAAHTSAPVARHWPLAEEMRRTPAPALLPTPPSDGAPSDKRSTGASDDRPGSTAGGEPAADTPPGAASTTPRAAEATDDGPGRHRGDRTAGTSRGSAPESGTGRTASPRRSKRSSIPSWDDIMFGAKQD
jgi:hypothetical protein